MKRVVLGKSLRLHPPSADDLEWMARALDRDEVARAFGYSAGAGASISARRAELVVGIIERAARRVGFVLVFPPTPSFPVPEIGYAIPDRRDRDAFTALRACDALAFYLFEELGCERVGWRVKESNLAARAVTRRLGYDVGTAARVDGSAVRICQLDRARWDARRARLGEGALRFED